MQLLLLEKVREHACKQPLRYTLRTICKAVMLQAGRRLLPDAFLRCQAWDI